MSNTTLSVYLNIDRIYLTATKVEDNRATLIFIESTDHHLDLENQNSEQSKLAISELEAILSQITFTPDRTTITLPAESIFITKFPAQPNFKQDQLKQLVNLELRQAYPEFSFENFNVKLAPIVAPKSGNQTMVGMMILKSDLDFINKLFAKYNLRIDNFEISQFAAYSSFMFNYPEMREKNHNDNRIPRPISRFYYS